MAQRSGTVEMAGVVDLEAGMIGRDRLRVDHACSMTPDFFGPDFFVGVFRFLTRFTIAPPCRKR